jgi:hypothetical protein
MSRIGTSLLVLAIAGSLAGGSTFAQTSMDRAINAKDCKQQAKERNLTGADRNAFEKTCQGKAPK